MSTQAIQLRRSGFTLLEVLLGLAISALLVTAIAYALQASIQAAQSNAQAIEARQQATIGTDYMLNVIRRAESITLIPDTGNSAQALVAVSRVETPETLRTTTTTFELVGTSVRITSVVDTQDKATGTVATTTSVNDSAVANVKKLTFTAPRETDGVTRRNVTVSLTLSIPDRMAPNNAKRNAEVSVEATSIARGVRRNGNANANNANNGNGNGP